MPTSVHVCLTCQSAPYLPAAYVRQLLLQVCPEHVGVGELHVGWEMEAVARQARFWVKMEGHDIYGNHPAYTFWSKRKVLMEKGGINISIPCSSLKRLD